MARRAVRLGWLIAIYALLLVASHVTRRMTPPAPPPAGLETVTVAPVGRGAASGPPVGLAYRRWGVPGGGGPAVLLLHGSPGSSREVARLGEALAAALGDGSAPPPARRALAIAPDLPGFGASQHRVPDYSIRAHAGYALELIDALRIERVHLIGFSLGGAVAIELAAAAPERVASLTLLSATGVQELELLGMYPLNHAVHALQLGALWCLHEAVPHFGLLDGSMLSVEYARNFYDSDQRPIRGLLGTIDVPALILHGRTDPLVPLAAAREHHRLLPQSELVVIEGDHFVTFLDPARLVAPIADFVQRVESGAAVDRGHSTAERRRLAAAPFDPATVPRAGGISLAALMLLLALATLVTEDLTTIAAGLLVAQGRVGFLAATLACGGGIFAGDLLLFLAGRWLGRPALKRRPLRWLVPPERITAGSAWFAERGPVVILLSRFLPGTRLGTYVAAGVLRTPLRRFAGWFALGVALWTPLLVGISNLLGRRVFAWFDSFQRYALPVFAAAALLTWACVVLLRSLATWRGRRRLRGWWLRRTRWEFWPPWLFYPPVVAWVAWLGLRHRSPTLFTAANPALPAGGFLGESKAAILAALPADRVARFRRLEASLPVERRLAAARDFVEEHGLRLPLVLKPDVGQRGAGVRVLGSWRQADEALAGAGGDQILQEYVPGPEFGVFYYRLPGQPRGRILSITEKRLPEVVGDGTADLETLVLRDPRAVCLADLYLAGRGGAARRVPAAGERVRLTDLGTHCRGAVFLDGMRHATPALSAEIDRISRAFEGFYFGRYDVRAASEEAFRAGDGLRILELNGVTSEATHIYDPAYGLLDAYRVLFRQWALAFAIGERNRRRGVQPAPLGELARLLLAALGGRRPQPSAAGASRAAGSSPTARAKARPRSR